MALKRIAEIEICGARLDLAKGDQFRLVRTEADAYGELRGTELSLHDFLRGDGFGTASVDRFQAVLDLLGEAYQALASARSMRLGGEPGDQP